MKKIYKIILVLTFFLLMIFSASAQEILTVTASISSQTAAPGSSITLTFLIDYPVPNEISIYVPLYADFLSLDRVTVYPRAAGTRSAEEAQIQTVVEYRFIAVRAGRFTLEPFTIICPKGKAETNPFTINIIDPNTVQVFAPELSWDTVQPAAAGDRITLILRSRSWSSPQPQPAFFAPQVPAGVILSPLPVSAEERAGGIAVKLLLIPLSPGEIIFPARTLVHENTRFEIPALRINVRP